MKGLLLALRILAAAVLVAFLVFSPPYLMTALGRNHYREWLSGKREPWSGVLTLWHMVEFKTVQGSVTSYLENIAAQYEHAHPGVYIEVLGLAPDAVQDRLNRGERPHIWSFPMGGLSDGELSALAAELPAFSGDILPLRKEGDVYAAPYLYSGYLLLGNTVLIQELGLEWPSDAAGIAQALQQAMDARSTGRYGALCAPPLHAAALRLRGEMALEGDFKAAQVPFMIGDGRAFGDLTRKMSSGGFTFDALPLGGWTELVQYIGVDAQAAGGYGAHARGFVSLLLSEGAQKKVTALGAMPAVRLSEEPQYADAQLQAFYKAYSHPACADPALWAAGKAGLIELASRALSGDDAALSEFADKLQALSPGTGTP